MSLRRCRGHALNWLLRRLRVLNERAEKAGARAEQLTSVCEEYETKYDVCSIIVLS